MKRAAGRRLPCDHAARRAQFELCHPPGREKRGFGRWRLAPLRQPVAHQQAGTDAAAGNRLR